MPPPRWAAGLLTVPELLPELVYTVIVPRMGCLLLPVVNLSQAMLGGKTQVETGNKAKLLIC